MVRKLQSILVLSLLIVTTSVGQKKLYKAHKQYNLKHYSLAIDTYNEYLKKDPSNIEARSNLADSYRMSNQLIKASEIYEELVTISDIDASVIKNYALTLSKMGKYDQAKYYFKIYKVYNPEEGSHFVMSCDFAKNLFEKPITHDIELAAFNTNRSDFGVSFLKDKVVFSSFRNDISKEEDRVSQALNGNILYIADIDEDMRTSNVRTLRSGIAEKNNIGPVSYNEPGGIVVYAENKIQDGGAHVTGHDSKHSLHVATLTQNGDWKDDHSFRYNEFGTSTAFPSLAFDGSALYFSSNRVGGYGGYDIYVSYLKEGRWTYPVNLGPKVNSKGNEITPFFQDETIYFASDYLHGMGGFDIFKSSVIGGQWSFPENMGNGINSPGDDYYPASKRGSDILFFSSNRLGGKGMDDVYLAVPVSETEEIFEEEYVEATPPPAISLTDYVSNSNQNNISNPLANTVSNQQITEVSLLDLNDEPRDEIALSTIPLRRNNEFKVDFRKTIEPQLAENPELKIGAYEISDDPIVYTDEQVPEAYKIPDFKSVSPSSAPLNLDLSKARRVSLGHIVPKSQVYFIQLAALYSSSGNVEEYSALKKYGNIYKIYHANSTKIRLGYFLDKQEAQSVLNRIRNQGYSDAFITTGYLNGGEVELVGASDMQSEYESYASKSSSTKVKSYKIRLASYEDPIWFDIQKAKGLGQIEQWTKGTWTIFLLGGFQTYEAAEAARIRAVNQGFSDAEVVVDNNGILERLRKN